MFENLAIIGVGLMGGSIGLAAKKYRLAHRVLGIGRREATLQTAKRVKAIDSYSLNYQDLASADGVILCAPVETIPNCFAELAEYLQPGTFVTDAGSTKQTLVKAIELQIRRRQLPVEFVGSHPMAGSEKTGVEHARADMFSNRAVIITPTKTSLPTAVQKLTQFWHALGAKVFEKSPAEHDTLVAAISHVPHLVASALAASTPEAALPLAAGGWLDTTRIAAGDVELWRQILLQNRSHILKSLVKFEKTLHTLHGALEDEHEATLVRILTAGKRTRDSVGN